MNVITAPILEAWEKYCWDQYAWYPEQMPYFAKCEVAEKFAASLQMGVQAEDAIFNFLVNGKENSDGLGHH